MIPKPPAHCTLEASVDSGYSFEPGWQHRKVGYCMVCWSASGQLAICRHHNMCHDSSISAGQAPVMALSSSPNPRQISALEPSAKYILSILSQIGVQYGEHQYYCGNRDRTNRTRDHIPGYYKAFYCLYIAIPPQVLLHHYPKTCIRCWNEDLLPYRQSTSKSINYCEY